MGMLLKVFVAPLSLCSLWTFIFFNSVFNKFYFWSILTSPSSIHIHYLVNIIYKILFEPVTFLYALALESCWVSCLYSSRKGLSILIVCITSKFTKALLRVDFFNKNCKKKHYHINLNVARYFLLLFYCFIEENKFRFVLSRFTIQE